MIYTEFTKMAMRICYEAHKDQFDKNDVPYVFHPFHIAEQMKDEDTTIVALLHDVVEDTEYTLDDLKDFGFSQEIISAVAAITHDPEVSYMEYIEQVKRNPIAAAVKIEDLKHNSDLTRLDEVTAKDVQRNEEYKKALAYLVGSES